MKNRTIAMLLTAALLGGTAIPALAGQPPPPPRDGDDYSYHHPEWGKRGHRRGGPGMHQRGPRGDWGERGERGWRHRDGDDFGSGWHRGGPGLHHRMFGELGITAEQKAKYIDMMTENFRAGLEAKMEMAEARGKLRDAQRSDTPDADAIVEANKAMGEAKGKLDALRATHHANLEAILTPEQKAKIDEWRSAPPPSRGDRDDIGPGPDGERGPRPGFGPRPGRGPGYGPRHDGEYDHGYGRGRRW